MTTVRAREELPSDRRRHGRELRRRRHRVPRWAVATTLIGLLLVWLAALASTGLSVVRDLRAAETALARADARLGSGDLSAGQQELGLVLERTGDAAEALRSPHVLPLRVVPVVGANLRAVSAVTESIAGIGAAGEELLAAAAREEVGDAHATDRDVSLAGLAELAPPLRELSATLQSSTARVEAAASPWLVGPIADAHADYLERVVPLLEPTDAAADLVEALPTFLGAEGERTYLLGASSLSELRASGGLMGSWTLLSAEDWTLSFGEFADVDDLAAPQTDVQAPSEAFAARHERFGALREWRNANLTPDFPSSAQVMSELWQAHGDAVDGVIMVDPVAFARLVEHSGPLDVPGVTTLAPDNALRFIALDAYAAFDSRAERKEVLGGIAAAAFTEVFDVLRGEDLVHTLGTLRSLVDGGHVRVYSRDADVQAAMARVGLSGALPQEPGELAGVFVNNVAGNKVDWFTRRRVVHQIQLLPGGVTSARIEASFDNRAPREGYPRHVLGPWTDHTEAGDNFSLVSALCGLGCDFGALPVGMTDGGHELGHPVADVRLIVPAGQRREISYRTRTPNAWRVEGERIVVDVVHLLQPTLHPTELEVRITPPPGWVPVDPPAGAVLSDGDLVWQSRGSGEVELTFPFSRTPDGPQGAVGRPHPILFEDTSRTSSAADRDIAVTTDHAEQSPRPAELSRPRTDP